MSEPTPHTPGEQGLSKGDMKKPDYSEVLEAGVWGVENNNKGTQQGLSEMGTWPKR